MKDFIVKMTRKEVALEDAKDLLMKAGFGRRSEIIQLILIKQHEIYSHLREAEREMEVVV